MTTQQLLHRLLAAGVQLRAEEGRLRYRAPNGALTDDLLALVAQHKPALLSLLREGRWYLRLSSAQTDIWLQEAVQAGRPQHRALPTLTITGPLDRAALEQALQDLLERHDALRTGIETLGGQPVQVIHDRCSGALHLGDLRGLDDAARQEQSAAACTALVRQGFDNSRPPLLKVLLLREGEESGRMQILLHQLISDGWSAQQLMQELARDYNAYVGMRQAADMGMRPFLYQDWVLRESEYLRSDRFQQDLAFWEQGLMGAPVARVPADYERLSDHPAATGEIWWTASQQLAGAIRQTARRCGVTPFVFMLTGFALLLSSAAGATDLTIGVPFANRSAPEYETALGRYANTLPLRLTWSGTRHLGELLRQVGQHVLAVQDHLGVSVAHIVERLRPQRIPGTNPLYQTLFVFQQRVDNLVPDLRGLNVQSEETQGESTALDLAVQVWEADGGYRCKLEYAADLVAPGMANLYARRLAWVWEQMCTAIERPVADLEALLPGEAAQLVSGSEQSTRPSGQESVIDLFHARVAAAPDAVALEFGESRLTYADLLKAARRLSAGLISAYGVGRGRAVAMLYERSPDAIIALLAIMMAGGAYVPLDPASPPARIRAILADADPAFVLVGEGLHDKCSGLGREVVRHADALRLAGQAGVLPAVLPGHPDAHARAYILFTSGTTGRPKGVMVKHGGLRNLALAQMAWFRLHAGARVLQLAPLHFDASVSEIFTTLLAGGTLVLAENHTLLPGPGLVQFLQDRAISTLTITPSALAHMPVAELASLTVLVLAGEPCPRALVQRWSAPLRTILNAYGPTEATVCATCGEVRADDPYPPAIGRPLANARVYLLDERQRLVPTGGVGEIYISGEGVAEGYINQPTLTERAFLPDPFVPEARMYRTGDYGRWRCDGVLAFHGRRDEQVKIRGMRVELHEIGEVLRQHPAVVDAALVVQPAAGGDPSLTACVVPRHGDAERAVILQQWHTFYDQHYGVDQAGDVPATPFQGWNDSYTGRPIAPAQMQEWQRATVQRLLRLNPRRVLEIGCGSGLIAEQLAPSCEAYYATDLSEQALAKLQARVAAGAFVPPPEFQLLARPAHDLTGLTDKAFDVVVLNSIVQYFPDLTYLEEVVQGALRCLAPTGALFLGDIRDYDLLAAFHASIELFHSAVDRGIDELRRQVERRVRRERELCVAVRFWHRLAGAQPAITDVQVMPKEMTAENELARFRYDVLLRRGDGYTTPGWTDSSAVPVRDAEEAARYVQQLPRGQTGVVRLVQARLVRDRHLPALLRAPEASGRDVAWLWERLAELPMAGVDPTTVVALARARGLAVRLECCANAPGEYVAILYEPQVGATAAGGEPFRASAADMSDQTPTANSPWLSQLQRELAPQLRSYLSQSLPEYMLPRDLILVDRLPLTSNGKLDVAAVRELAVLPDDEELSPEAEGPLTDLEQRIARAWSQALGRRQVRVAQNFFDLGGHSLLVVQVHMRLQDELGRSFPIVTLFQYPTVRSLAEHLSTLADPAPSPAETGEPEVQESVPLGRGWAIRARRRSIMEARRGAP